MLRAGVAPDRQVKGCVGLLFYLCRLIRALASLKEIRWFGCLSLLLPDVANISHSVSLTTAPLLWHVLVLVRHGLPFSLLAGPKLSWRTRAG